MSHVRKIGRLSICFCFALQLLAQKGGMYKDLRNEQRALIDRMVVGFSKQTGQKIDPATTYDSSPQSMRTTFDSVTHALLMTKLTAEDGKPLGTAFDAIDVVHQIAGESSSSPFRVHFTVKPNTRDILERSREFRRRPDNILFRSGYLVRYRLEGTPSLEFSLSADSKSADVSIDYRSSKFPDALINGYMAAAIADVRAGQNGQKHNSRWNGLALWWSDLFGGTEPAATVQSGRARTDDAKEKIQDAAQDFYQAWLVNKAPEVAASYFSQQVYGCAELGPRAHKQELDRALTRAYIAEGLAKYESEQITAMEPWNPDLKPVKHEASERFLLAEVDARFAESHDCSRLANPAEMRRREGKFYVTASRTNERDIFFLWGRDAQSWRIVAYHRLEGKAPAVFSGATAEAIPSTVRVTEMDGDPELVKTVRDFLRRWLVKRNPDRVLEYLLPDALACAAEDDPAWLSRPPGALRRRLVSGMDRVAKERLTTTAPAVKNTGARVLRHQHQEDFLIFGVSDQTEGLFRCASPLPKEELRAAFAETATFGNLYVSGVRMKNVSGEPSVLLAAWRKTPHGWRIFWWRVETP